MREIVWTKGAEADFDDLYAYFEEIREGKGEEFFAALYQSELLLRKFSELAPIYQRPFRRLLVYKRTVGVYYVLEPRGVVIHIVFRLVDSPALLERRINQVTQGLIKEE